MKFYLVGGAIRDQMLQLPVTEKDWVVVGASEEDLLARGFQRVGKDFPVFLHPDTKDEYALARTERKKGKGYKGFEVHASPDVTLEQDLLRRDLTINAMAQDEDGALIDPYGGQIDIGDRLLRHVSAAFIEDPLRVLRVARFAARFASLGFRVAPETITLMRELVASGEMSYLVAERVWLETEKALHSESPWIYFEILRECGALRILFPELDKLFGVPQPEKHHPEIDAGIHTMMVLKQASGLSTDIGVRWAALLHDLGKGETPAELWPKHHGHEAKSLALIKKISKRFRVPRQLHELACLAAEFHGLVHKACELTPSTLLKMLDKIGVWRNRARLNDLLIACKADSLGRKGCESHDYPQEDFIQACVSACAQVGAQPFIEAGKQGSEIKEAIRSARLVKIKEVKRKMCAEGMSKEQD